MQQHQHQYSQQPLPLCLPQPVSSCSSWLQVYQRNPKWNRPEFDQYFKFLSASPTQIAKVVSCFSYKKGLSAFVVWACRHLWQISFHRSTDVKDLRPDQTGYVRSPSEMALVFLRMARNDTFYLGIEFELCKLTFSIAQERRGYHKLALTPQHKWFCKRAEKIAVIYLIVFFDPVKNHVVFYIGMTTNLAGSRWLKSPGTTSAAHFAKTVSALRSVHSESTAEFQLVHAALAVHFAAAPDPSSWGFYANVFFLQEAYHPFATEDAIREHSHALETDYINAFRELVKSHDLNPDEYILNRT